MPTKAMVKGGGPSGSVAYMGEMSLTGTENSGVGG